MLLSSFGCASKRVPVSSSPGEANGIESKKSKQAPMTDIQQVAEDESEAVRLIKTPFGVIKQKVIPTAVNKQDILDSQNILMQQKGKETVAQKVSKRSELKKKTDPLQNSGVDSSKSDDSLSGGGVFLNFDEADLIEVIRTLAELLQINYSIDPGMRGTVTIHTAGKIAMSDLWPVFFQILEANGMTAIKEGNVYKITDLKDAPRYSIQTRYGTEIKDLPPSERVVMQIIPLRYVKAEEMVKILTPFVSAEGTIISHGESNTLLVVDKGSNILKTLKLVEAFDADFLEKITHQFYFLTYADAEEVATLVKDIMSSYDKIGASSFKLITISRLNALLVIAEDKRIFEKIEVFLKTFDVPNDVVQKRLFVYSVKNGEAGELSELLNNIFNDEMDSGDDEQNGSNEENKENKPKNRGSLFTKKTAAQNNINKQTGQAGNEASGTGTLRSDVKITPDEIRNSLIIEATPQDYKIIEKILTQLDVMPRQVLIEVMVAEIKLDDETQLGVEWSYKEGNGGPGTKTLSSSIGSSGLSYVIGEADRWSAALNAMASEGKINLLSSPSVLASDNKEAKIDITTEEPVVSSITSNISSDNPVSSTSVEYRDTGIILSVTPHITENGLVSMEISQEVSEAKGSKTIGDVNYPTFFKRSVNTNLIVKHNQTIVIGGLIKEDSEGGTAGVPVLSKIPGIGFVFGSNSNKSSKTELIILITPRVIVNLNDVDLVTDEFKRKVKNTNPLIGIVEKKRG